MLPRKALSFLGLGFIVITLVTVVSVTNNPLQKFFINSMARYSPEALINRRERAGARDSDKACKGAGCLADIIIANRDNKNNQVGVAATIIQTYDNAVAGDTSALAELHNLNAGVANQVESSQAQQAAQAPPTEIVPVPVSNLTLDQVTGNTSGNLFISPESQNIQNQINQLNNFNPSHLQQLTGGGEDNPPATINNPPVVNNTFVQQTSGGYNPPVVQPAPIQQYVPTQTVAEAVNSGLIDTNYGPYYTPDMLPTALQEAVNSTGGDSLSLSQDPLMAATLNKELLDCYSSGSTKCNEAFTNASATKDTGVAFYALQDPDANIDDLVAQVNEERATALVTTVGVFGGIYGGSQINTVADVFKTIRYVQNTAAAYQTLSTGSYCAQNGWDESCKQQTGRTVLTWVTLGTSQYANVANNTLGMVLNTGVSGFNLYVDSGDAYQAFTNPETDTLTKAMTVVALLGDIGGGVIDYNQGQLFKTKVPDINTPRIDIFGRPVTPANPVDAPPVVTSRFGEVLDEVAGAIVNDVPAPKANIPPIDAPELTAALNPPPTNTLATAWNSYVVRPANQVADSLTTAKDNVLNSLFPNRVPEANLPANQVANEVGNTITDVKPAVPDAIPQAKVDVTQTRPIINMERIQEQLEDIQTQIAESIRDIFSKPVKTVVADPPTDSLQKIVDPANKNMVEPSDLPTEEIVAQIQSRVNIASSYEELTGGNGDIYDDLLTIIRAKIENGMDPVKAVARAIYEYHPKKYAPINPDEMAYKLNDPTALASRLTCGSKLNCLELPILEKQIFDDLGIESEIIISTGGTKGEPEFPYRHGAIKVGDRIVGYYAPQVLNADDFQYVADAMRWGDFELETKQNYTYKEIDLSTEQAPDLSKRVIYQPFEKNKTELQVDYKTGQVYLSDGAEILPGVPFEIDGRSYIITNPNANAGFKLHEQLVDTSVDIPTVAKSGDTPNSPSSLTQPTGVLARVQETWNYVLGKPNTTVKLPGSGTTEIATPPEWLSNLANRLNPAVQKIMFADTPITNPIARLGNNIADVWNTRVVNGPIGDFVFGHSVLENLDSPLTTKLVQQNADLIVNPNKNTEFAQAVVGESVGGNAGDGYAAVNGVIDRNGNIISFGNIQDIPDSIRAKLDSGETYRFSVQVKAYSTVDDIDPKYIIVYDPKTMPTTLQDVLKAIDVEINSRPLTASQQREIELWTKLVNEKNGVSSPTQPTGILAKAGNWINTEFEKINTNAFSNTGEDLSNLVGKIKVTSTEAWNVVKKWDPLNDINWIGGDSIEPAQIGRSNNPIEVVDSPFNPKPIADTGGSGGVKTQTKPITIAQVADTTFVDSPTKFEVGQVVGFTTVAGLVLIDNQLDKNGYTGIDEGVMNLFTNAVNFFTSPSVTSAKALGNSMPEYRDGKFIFTSPPATDIQNITNNAPVKTGEQIMQENMLSITNNLTATDLEQLKLLAASIGENGTYRYDFGENFCGPFSAEILKKFGLFSGNIDDMYMFNPDLDMWRLKDLFPDSKFTKINTLDKNQTIGDIGYWRSNPLKVGDFIYLDAKDADTFEHMLVVDYVDNQGRAYSTTNHFVIKNGVKTFTVDRVLLYDPNNSTAGMFYKWSNPEFKNTIGNTGNGGFLIVRPNQETINSNIYIQQNKNQQTNTQELNINSPITEAANQKMNNCVLGQGGFYNACAGEYFHGTILGSTNNIGVNLPYTGNNSPTDLYWCTDLVYDAANAAGIEFKYKISGARTLYDDMKANKSVVLSENAEYGQNVKLGMVAFVSKPQESGTYNVAHVGIVSKINKIGSTTYVTITQANAESVEAVYKLDDQGRLTYTSNNGSTYFIRAFGDLESYAPKANTVTELPKQAVLVDAPPQQSKPFDNEPLTKVNNSTIDIPYFSQYDPNYAKIGLVGDCTISNKGCTVMVASMVTQTEPKQFLTDYNAFYGYGPEVTNPRIDCAGSTIKLYYDYLDNSGYDIVPIIGNKDYKISEIKKYTDGGSPVWVDAYLCTKRNNGGGCVDELAHAMVVTGVNNNGQLVYNDPANWDRVGSTTLPDYEIQWDKFVVNAIVPEQP